MKKLLILLMNYKSEDEIISYIEQLEKLNNIDKIDICVVDNFFNKEKLLEKRLTNFNLNIFYFNPLKNLGYLNGALYGIDKYKDINNGFIPKWILISNTDIIYKDKDFYTKFFKKDYDENIWCIGPSVLNIKNQHCNPHYLERISLKKMNRNINLFKFKYFATFYSKLSVIKRNFKKNIKHSSCLVYSNHGCFFFLKKDFYNNLNGEKYEALLYSEESFIAEFIREKNKKAYYDNELEVIHTENLVTGTLKNAYKYSLISNSLKCVKRRFYNEK